MNIILFDDVNVKKNLLPMSFTRPLADFRVGITTIREKWERLIPGNYSYLTSDYLQAKFPNVKIERINKIQGQPFLVSEIVEQVKKLL